MTTFAIFAAACGLTASICPTVAPVMLALLLPVSALTIVAAVAIVKGGAAQ